MVQYWISFDCTGGFVVTPMLEYVEDVSEKSSSSRCELEGIGEVERASRPQK